MVLVQAGAVEASSVTVMLHCAGGVCPALIPGMLMTETEVPSDAMMAVPPFGVEALTIFRAEELGGLVGA